MGKAEFGDVLTSKYWVEKYSYLTHYDAGLHGIEQQFPLLAWPDVK